MDAIFEDLMSEGMVVVYLDNILIFTETLEEHQKVVQRVLEILQQHNLSLKPEKCEFEKSSVEYLGVVISHNSVNMDLVKVARVSKWPTPTNRKEVQLFAFLSKSLSPVERNYEIHDKEMLAIIRALEEWRHFLEGAEHQVEVWTDHKNLEYFMSAKKLNQRQTRWSLQLARSNFFLHHQPGKTMGKSDALSQRSDHGSGSKYNQNLTLLTLSLFVVRALEGLQMVRGEKDTLKEIRRGMEMEDQEEVVVKVV